MASGQVPFLKGREINGCMIVSLWKYLMRSTLEMNLCKYVTELSTSSKNMTTSEMWKATLSGNAKQILPVYTCQPNPCLRVRVPFPIPIKWSVPASSTVISDHFRPRRHWGGGGSKALLSLSRGWIHNSQTWLLLNTFLQSWFGVQEDVQLR